LSLQLTTELILTHPAGMGVTTATPAQRALFRSLDGLPLGNIADDPDVVEAFGGPAAIAALPIGEPPAEAHVLAAIRTCKTMGGAAHILATTQSVDVSQCALSDIVRITVSALKLEGCRPLMGHLLHTVSKPLLAPLVIGEPSEDRIVIRHPTGRPIEIVPVPIDRAGGSALSVWAAMVVVDEEPRMIGAEDGAIKNWDEFHRAAFGRILPGGKFLGIGSPHAPFGPIYDLFTKRFGKPGPDMMIFRGTGRAMNPSWWTEERCERVRRRDPEAYKSDVLADFRSVESSAFPIDAIEAAIGASVPEHGEVGGPIVAVDLSAMKHDACAIGVFRWVFPYSETSREEQLMHDVQVTDNRGNLSTMRVHVRDGHGRALPNPNYGQSSPPILQLLHLEGLEPGDPNRVTAVTGEVVADRVVAVARQFGAQFVAGDQFEELFFPAMLRARDPSLRYQAFAWTGVSKGPAIDRLRSLLVARQIILPKHAKLREELVRFRRVVTQGGEKFEAAPGSTHGDYVSTCITAIMADVAGCMPFSPTGQGDGPGVYSYCPYTNSFGS
jgi:hypothetical protein